MPLRWFLTRSGFRVLRHGVDNEQTTGFGYKVVCSPEQSTPITDLSGQRFFPESLAKGEFSERSTGIALASGISEMLTGRQTEGAQF